MDVVKPFLVRGWEDKKKTKTRPAPLKRGLCLAHAEVLGWQTPNWPQSRSRTRWVSTYQMWESSGMGSLDFVKKFFAMAPRKRVTFGGEIVWSCLFMCKCSRSGGGAHTENQGPQVRLQGLELIGVILQLFLCDPPGVIVRIVNDALLL